MWKNDTAKVEIKEQISYIQYNGKNYLDIIKGLHYSDRFAFAKEDNEDGYVCSIIDGDDEYPLSIGDYIFYYPNCEVHVKTAHWFETKYKDLFKE